MLNTSLALAVDTADTLGVRVLDLEKVRQPQVQKVSHATEV